MLDLSLTIHALDNFTSALKRAEKGFIKLSQPLSLIARKTKRRRHRDDARQLSEAGHPLIALRLDRRREGSGRLRLNRRWGDGFHVTTSIAVSERVTRTSAR